MTKRDTIVVGTSAGGLRALQGLLSGQPRTLPASVLVVQHQTLSSPRMLVPALQAATALQVRWVDGPESLHLGHVYVAPPDRHLVVADDHALVTAGPRENRTRPAINPLFRTAAAERGSRVIAVLLTGRLDDGVAGLAAVQRCGGVALVQDPRDAEYPDMPRHALAALKVEHVAPLGELSRLLQALAGEEAPPAEIPTDVAVEAAVSLRGAGDLDSIQAIGQPFPIGCPECGGPIWEVGRWGSALYRCHIGHAFSPQALMDTQSDEIEQSLWTAVRALTERATLLERMARDEGVRRPSGGRAYKERACEARAHAERARRFLLSLRAPELARSSPDPLQVDALDR